MEENACDLVDGKMLVDGSQSVCGLVDEPMLVWMLACIWFGGWANVGGWM